MSVTVGAKRTNWTFVSFITRVRAGDVAGDARFANRAREQNFGGIGRAPPTGQGIERSTTSTVAAFRTRAARDAVEVERPIFADRAFASDGDAVGVLHEERFRAWETEADTNRQREWSDGRE